MSIDLADDVKTARLQALANKIDAAATPGHLLLYTAPRPQRGAAAGPAALISDITLTKPCGVVTGNSLALTLPPVVLAAIDGDIAWGRLVDGDGNWRGDGDAGQIGSGAFIQSGNLHIYGGGLVGIAAATITE